MGPSTLQTGRLTVTKQDNIRKHIRAQELYHMVRVLLQEHFHLNMIKRDGSQQDVWQVVVTRAVKRISMEMISLRLEAASNRRLVRTLVKEMRQDMGASKR
jgi:hypothetical protein